MTKQNSTLATTDVRTEKSYNEETPKTMNRTTYVGLKPVLLVQPNLNNSSTFRTMNMFSRYELFEPLMVNHDVTSGSK